MGDDTSRRTKAAPTVEAGRGVPSMVTQTLKRGPTLTNIAAQAQLSKQQQRRSTSPAMDRTFTRSSRHKSILERSEIAQMSMMLDLDEYGFPDDDELVEPTAEHLRLDVTALDRYNDDIRKLRKMLIEECRIFPHRGDPDDATVRRIKGIVRSLCRSTFFGTHKSQVLAEATVTLIMWLLSKKNLPTSASVHLLQSFAEMVWSSEELKYALFRCNGSKILVKLLINGVQQRSDQARWACYTLAMACVGCKEIIDFLQGFSQLEEVVGEIAFHAYWANWPANFGQILQGILFGPHSVIPVEDSYQFL